ncbi:hypothetical protein ACHAXN_011440 [Cyclotella atomus]
MDHDAIPTLPTNPIDSYQSQLNFQYGPAGIVDVLDISLPAGEVGGFTFHDDSLHEHQNGDEGDVQNLSPHHEHHNVETAQYCRTDHESQNVEIARNQSELMHETADQIYEYQNVHGCENSQTLQYSCHDGHDGAAMFHHHTEHVPAQGYQHTDYDWQCDRCGVCNSGSDDRCASCQSYGDHYLAIAGTRENITDKHSDSTTKDEGCDSNALNDEDWQCDKCGQSSAWNKKRCIACHRWRNGKRTDMKFASPIMASDLVQPNPATIATLTAAGKWICHKCSAVNHKSRCSVCQSWKGARRHNLPKRSSTMSTDNHNKPAPVDPWACDKCNHTNRKGQMRCSSCQRWKDGKRLNIRVKSRNEVSTRADDLSVPSVAQTNTQPHVYNIDANWQCRCGSANKDSLRCKSCKSWKNSREQQQFHRQMSSFHEAPGHSLETVVTDTTKSWFCIRCNCTTATNSQHCDSCQRLRYPEQIQHQNNNQVHFPHHQLDQLAYQISAHSPYSVPAAYHGATFETQPVQVEQKPEPPWVCPRCSRENLASKSRCGGCQKWKGGVRESYKNRRQNALLAETWYCHKCNMQNSGKKVRCKTCQGWKDGGRPDVLARKALAAEARKAGTWWSCDKCGRCNKPRNQRCGGCQRWKMGCRPKKEKEAAAPSSSSILPAEQQLVPVLPPMPT